MILLILLFFQTSFGQQLAYPKCCDSSSVLKKTNSSYSCAEDLEKRTQIFADDVKSDDFCVDVSESVGLFQSNGTEDDFIKIKKLENIEFYPKCCPINYIYNSTSHGCIFNQTHPQEKFFDTNFIKVGLPHCKIIVDVGVNTHSYDLERLNGTLYVDKRTKFYPEGFYCVDKDQKGQFVARVCFEDFAICEKVKCVRKCCADGQSFVNGSKCRTTFVHGLDFSALAENVDGVKDSFAIIHDGFSPPLYPLNPKRFDFHMDSSGVFTMTELDASLGKINITRRYEVYQEGYCVEHAVKGTTLNQYMFFRGFPKNQTQIKFLYTRIAMVISCVCLFLTIVYYCVSNEKHTLFGKTLISYCLASLVTFLLIVYFTFDETRPENGATICKVFAFFCFYSTLATFTWMNIMCIDIYWTFGSSKSFSSRQHRSKELKRFMLYSLYGWGLPLGLTAIPSIFYHLDALPATLQVIVNEQKCLLYKGDGNYALLVFSTIPLALLEVCNLVLFVLTAMYCLRVKREINKMNDTHVMKGEKRQKLGKFRDRFGLLMKLFLIMGISFLFEVVSSFYDFKKNDTMAVIEIIWDTFNSLQGLFIFLIFLVKKRIFKKFEKKVGLQKLRKFSLVSSVVTQTTSLPTMSK